MSLPRTFVRRLTAVALAGACAAVPDAHARPPAGSGAFQVRMAGRAGTAMRRALHAVRLRLADEPCRGIFSDFDASGRPLDEVLESRGRSAGEHLDSLVFQDGSGKARCERPDVLAFTHVGGDTIFVCAGSFGRAADRDPRFAEIVVIHEVLHTLGLRENPPTSSDITARVEERCGTHPTHPGELRSARMAPGTEGR